MNQKRAKELNAKKSNFNQRRNRINRAECLTKNTKVSRSYLQEQIEKFLSKGGKITKIDLPDKPNYDFDQTFIDADIFLGNAC